MMMFAPPGTVGVVVVLVLTVIVVSVVTVVPEPHGQLSVTDWPTAFFRHRRASLAVMLPLPSGLQMHVGSHVSDPTAAFRNEQAVTGRRRAAVRHRLAAVALRRGRRARGGQNRQRGDRSEREASERERTTQTHHHFSSFAVSGRARRTRARASSRAPASDLRS
jgi:hypothetical protein